MEPYTKPLKVISLFAGVGGIDLGFQQAGAHVVWANDNDKYAKITYELNFPNSPYDGRGIAEVPTNEIPDHDILSAGFPCQAFSIAGYRRGFNDHRGNLFFEIERILLEKKNKPKAIFLENVKNLKNHDHKNTFKVITGKLADAGYHIKEKVLNTAEYGNIPQNRERIYIVGFRDEQLADQFEFPEKIKLTKKVYELIDRTQEQNHNYYYSEKSQYYPMLSEALANGSAGTVFQIRRIYIRENKSQLCPTLTANMGTGGHNVPIIRDDFGIRKLTPRETFLFQGFPSNYQLPKGIANSHLYKQAGNSVSVPVIARIAERIVDLLKE